jgi:RHS repeat-associated protein
MEIPTMFEPYHTEEAYWPDNPLYSLPWIKCTTHYNENNVSGYRGQADGGPWYELEKTRDNRDRLTQDWTYFCPTDIVQPLPIPLFRNEYTYDTDDRVIGINVIHGKDISMCSWTYTYDNDDHLASVSKQNGVATKTASYEYDANSQLIRENDQQSSKTSTFTYDNRGNLQGKKEYAYTTGALGSPTSTKNYVYSDPSWPDLLTSYKGNLITYDANGNPLTYNGWTYTWEGGRLLQGMSKGATNITYKYDEEGLRTEKTVGNKSIKYRYLNGKMVSQINTLDPMDTMIFLYDNDDELIGFMVDYIDNEFFRYLKNAQGDVIAIVEGDRIVVEYAYDAWGDVTSMTGPDPVEASALGELNPIRYRSYYYDTETKLYYLQSRYYDPEMGRFINADLPTVPFLLKDVYAGTNLFTYCRNNPVMMHDPTGHAAQTLKALFNEIKNAILGVIPNPHGYNATDLLKVKALLLGKRNPVEVIKGMRSTLLAAVIATGYITGAQAGLAAGLAALNASKTPTNISAAGINLIKRIEVFRKDKYKATSTEAHYTIGYGHSMNDGKNYVTIGGKQYTSLTEAQASTLLKQDLNNTFLPPFNKFLSKNNINLKQNQYDACIVDCFQKGQNIWGDSKYSISNYLLKKTFNDYAKCLSAFLASNPGRLTGRRTAEAQTFYYNNYDYRW